LLWTIIPLAIWLQDRGAIFYRQRRVGQGGKEFDVLKFRTMVPHADELGPAWTTERDPRVTRVGRLLRKTALDELPQLLNIVRGDMSFVGPKPLAVEEFQQLCQEIPGFQRRLEVAPGLTGLAQYYNSTDDSGEKLRYDLSYIQHMSLWLDVKLMLLSAVKTITAQWDGRAAKPKQRPEPLESSQQTRSSQE
jgi:lipopolysaccharide/colanic/teichoic acid biosynthesis glycosyltransferase